MDEQDWLMLRDVAREIYAIAPYVERGELEQRFVVINPIDAARLPNREALEDAVKAPVKFSHYAPTGSACTALPEILSDYDNGYYDHNMSGWKLKAPGRIRHLPYDHHRDLYIVRWHHHDAYGNRHGHAMGGVDPVETEKALIRCVNRYYREDKLDELRLGRDRLGISMY